MALSICSRVTTALLDLSGGCTRLADRLLLESATPRRPGITRLKLRWAAVVASLIAGDALAGLARKMARPL